MNSKILLLSIAVVAVGLFAMPSTLTLFSGQHTFYAGENVSCKKCHQDVYNEMSYGSTSTAHTTQSLNSSCVGCHRTGSLTNVPANATNLTTFSQNVTSNPNAHAAVTLECITCHTGVDEELRGGDEAHTAFYYKSANTTNSSAGLSTVNNTVIKLKGANTACVGCHTHAAINITWTRSTGYNMTVDGTGGSWSMTFSVNTTSKNSTSAGE